MTSQVPFEPRSPAALARLTAEEREAEETRAREKLAAIHEAVVTRFLGDYGTSSLPTFKVAIDLASSVRKILAGSGERVIAAETARAEAAEAKLAAIEVQCRGLLEHAASVNVPPSRTHLSVVHILAIISGEAGNG